MFLEGVVPLPVQIWCRLPVKGVDARAIPNSHPRHRAPPFFYKLWKEAKIETLKSRFSEGRTLRLLLEKCHIVYLDWKTMSRNSESVTEWLDNNDVCYVNRGTTFYIRDEEDAIHFKLTWG